MDAFWDFSFVCMKIITVFCGRNLALLLFQIFVSGKLVPNETSGGYMKNLFVLMLVLIISWTQEALLYAYLSFLLFL